MKQGEVVGGLLVLAIILFAVMSAVGPGTKYGDDWLYLTKGVIPGQSQHSPAGGNLPPASGSSILGSPSLSAQQIDTILANAGSPAAGTGQDLYNLGVQYNIDPAFALAVFFNESNFGRSGEAVNSHSLGNLRCISGAACVNGYAWFNSWQDGYAAFYRLVSGPVYVGSGLTTPETILPKYAPSGDNNNPSHYANVVESAMSLWRSGSTGVPA